MDSKNLVEAPAIMSKKRVRSNYVISGEQPPNKFGRKGTIWFTKQDEMQDTTLVQRFYGKANPLNRRFFLPPVEPVVRRTKHRCPKPENRVRVQKGQAKAKSPIEDPMTTSHSNGHYKNTITEIMEILEDSSSIIENAKDIPRSFPNTQWHFSGQESMLQTPRGSPYLINDPFMISPLQELNGEELNLNPDLPSPLLDEDLDSWLGSEIANWSPQSIFASGLVESSHPDEDVTINQKSPDHVQPVVDPGYESNDESLRQRRSSIGQENVVNVIVDNGYESTVENGSENTQPDNVLSTLSLDQPSEMVQPTTTENSDISSDADSCEPNATYQKETSKPSVMLSNRPHTRSQTDPNLLKKSIRVYQSNFEVPSYSTAKTQKLQNDELMDQDVVETGEDGEVNQDIDKKNHGRFKEVWTVKPIRPLNEEQVETVAPRRPKRPVGRPSLKKNATLESEDGPIIDEKVMREMSRSMGIQRLSCIVPPFLLEMLRKYVKNILTAIDVCCPEQQVEVTEETIDYAIRALNY